MIKSKGLFISFEGGEASGKTTQIKILKNWLINEKIPHILTREPGGTKFSEYLRKLILSSKINIDTNMEVLLLMAARLDHIDKIIKPALNKNKIVICDRFVDSTAIYQGHYNNFGIKKVFDLHKLFLNNLLPNITFFFNSNSELVKKRLIKRKYKNKYDLIDKKFNNSINTAYLKLAKKNKRFKIIDASLSIKDIHNIIRTILLKKITNYGFKKSKYK